MEGTCKAMKELAPTSAMAVVQLAYAGMNILLKLAADDGMNLRILVAYRLIFALAFMLSLTLALQRGKRPKFTWKLLSLSFLSGLLGTSLANNNSNAVSLAKTSATSTTAVSILVPGFTFILAVILRLENLRMGTAAGKAKVLGTLLGVGGTLVFTFYRGVEINLWSTRIDLFHRHQVGHKAKSQPSSTLCAFVGLASTLSYVSWLLLQAKISQEYQGHDWNTILMCTMGTAQAVGFAACTVREWKEWRLAWNVRLLASAYSGIVVSGIVVTLISWCIRLKGPLFASTFSPLSLVIVAVLGSLLSEEKLHVGR